MISKADIRQYLSEAEALEKKMVETYDYLAQNLKNEYYKSQFQQLCKEEGQHVRIVKEIKDLLLTD